MATRVAIVGGGISGLSTAFRIRQRLPEAELLVLEAGERLGGSMATRQVSGYRIETGPNGFLDNKPHTLELVRDLGLEDRLLPADASSKIRYLFLDGRLVPLPTSPPGFLLSSVLPWHAKLRVLLEPWRPVGPGDETLAEFGRRRLGKAVVERLLDPFVAGIFAGAPQQLSVAAAFPAVKALEQEYGSLIRGMRARARARRRGGEAVAGSPAGGATGPSGHLHSFKEGMGELVAALEGRLGESVLRSVRVREVRRVGEAFEVHCEDGRSERVDAVVSAAPAFRAAEYLRPLSEPLAEALSAIPYAAVAVVATGFKREDFDHPLCGFGFICPSREQRRILGVLFTSSIYPGHRAPEGRVLLRTMVGGVRAPELVSLPDEALVELVREEHCVTMGVRWGEPEVVEIVRWPRGIPQYEVGHLERVARIEALCAEVGGLFVTGNHQRGVGVNDCVRDAGRIAEAVHRWVTQRG